MTETAPNFSTPVDHSDQQLGPFLGEGGQYKVYDMGDTVRKVPQTVESSAAAITEWHHGTEEERTEYAKMLIEHRERGAYYVKQVVEAVPQAAKFFGNPKFLEDGTIIQDKMPSLGEAMDAHPEKAEDYLWGYVRSMNRSWKLGCADVVFNMRRNMGVKDGEVVLRDFGEMTFDKETVKQLVREQKWEQSYDYQHELTPDQQAFMRGSARAMLTKEGVDDRWCVDLPR